MKNPTHFALIPSRMPDVFTVEMAVDVPEAVWAPDPVAVPKALIPLRMRRTSATRRIRHFMMGPTCDSRLVSAGFRALLEEMDPGVHTFVPVALEMDPGVVETGKVWLLKTGRMLDALRAESLSALRPVVGEKGTLIATQADTWPMLRMRRDVVGNTPFWRQDHLLYLHFCNRDFLREITLRGLEPIERVGYVMFDEEDFHG